MNEEYRNMLMVHLLVLLSDLRNIEQREVVHSVARKSNQVICQKIE